MKSFLTASELLSHLLPKLLTVEFNHAWTYGVVYVFCVFIFKLDYKVLMHKKWILLFHAKHVTRLAECSVREWS